MSSPDLLLVELTSMAETPLYSAYRWLNDAYGRPIDFPEFLHVVDEMLHSDVIRMWSVAGADRTEWYEVPSGLASRYLKSGHDDRRYDPFGMSIGLSEQGAAPLGDWEVDLRLDDHTFALRIRSNARGDVFNRLTRLFPDLNFVVDNEATYPDGTVVSGRVEEL
jgi:hypothetical protein